MLIRSANRGLWNTTAGIIGTIRSELLELRAKIRKDGNFRIHLIQVCNLQTRTGRDPRTRGRPTRLSRALFKHAGNYSQLHHRHP